MSFNFEGFRPGTQQLDSRQGNQHLMAEVTNDWRIGGKSIPGRLSKDNGSINGELFLPSIQLEGWDGPPKNIEQPRDRAQTPGKNGEQPSTDRGLDPGTFTTKNREQQSREARDKNIGGERDRTPAHNAERGTDRSPAQNPERGTDRSPAQNPGRGTDRTPAQNPEREKEHGPAHKTDRETDHSPSKNADKGTDGGHDTKRSYYDPSKPGTKSDQLIDFLTDKGWQQTKTRVDGGIGVWDCDGEPLLMVFDDNRVEFAGINGIQLETCPIDPENITFFEHSARKGGQSEPNP